MQIRSHPHLDTLSSWPPKARFNSFANENSTPCEKFFWLLQPPSRKKFWLLQPASHIPGHPKPTSTHPRPLDLDFWTPLVLCPNGLNSPLTAHLVSSFTSGLLLVHALLNSTKIEKYFAPTITPHAAPPPLKTLQPNMAAGTLALVAHFFHTTDALQHCEKRFNKKWLLKPFR